MPMLPIHFFSIVLNGQPFIRYHLDVFRSLSCPWHWHIVEGVADLVRDTAWSKRQGGRIAASLHQEGRSNDGTSDYLDSIAAAEPDRVTLYRRPPGLFWDGKLAMVSAPLEHVAEECLLWQIDADELWTAQQIETAHRMFTANPTRTAAYYLCHYFVGRSLVTTSADQYGNYRTQEWLRTWRMRPGDRWVSHEPPRLVRPAMMSGRTDDEAKDVATLSAFSHEETAAAGLVFQHYAYATPDQAAFKEIYYGYAGATAQWRALQACTSFPQRLRDFFPWVTDEAMVDRAERLMAEPLAHQQADGWRFTTHMNRTPERLGMAAAVALLRRAGPAPRRRLLDSRQPPTLSIAGVRSIAVFRLDNIGDMVTTSGFLRELRRLFPAARITVFASPGSADLLRPCPSVNQVIKVAQHFNAPPHDPTILELERQVREHFNGSFDLAINPRGAEDIYSANRLMLATGAPLRLGYRQPHPVSYDADGCLTHLMALPDTPWHALRSVALLRAFSDGPLDPTPELWTTPGGEQAAADLLAANPPAHRLCAIGIGASQPYRQWNAEHFAVLCRDLIDRHGMTPVLVGGPEDTAAAAMIAAAAGPCCINAVGRTTLEVLCALVARCHLFVGNDSGPKHIAAAAGLPVVEIGWFPANSTAAGHPEGGLARCAPYGVPTRLVEPVSVSDVDILTGRAVNAVSVEAVSTAVGDLISSLSLGGRR